MITALTRSRHHLKSHHHPKLTTLFELPNLNCIMDKVREPHPVARSETVLRGQILLREHHILVSLKLNQ